MADVGICALCLDKRDLRLSHIVPSFFGVHLKETSATGYLRSPNTPNLRVQDLVKRRLLCDSCEGRFADWEREYREKAFDLLQDDDFTGLQYGPWLLSFLVSLSWRVLVNERADIIKARPEFGDVIERTLENWRVCLLGERGQPGSEHHLFIFAGIPESMPEGSHERSLDYIYRSVDAATALGKRGLFVYTKALRSLVFSPIVPSSPGGWHNTRIHAAGGTLVSPQRIAMNGFGAFLNSRVKLAFDQHLSKRQVDKIAEVMLRNPNRALNSESYKVRLASRRLIGKTRGE